MGQRQHSIQIVKNESDLRDFECDLRDLRDLGATSYLVMNECIFFLTEHGTNLLE